MGTTVVQADQLNAITEQIIGAAIGRLAQVCWNRPTKPAWFSNFASAACRVEQQKPLPIAYKGVKLDCGYRLDLVVADCVIVEIKAVEKLNSVHEAQLLSYLKLANYRVGLLLNFHCTMLKHGIRRLVNNFPSSANSAISAVK